MDFFIKKKERDAIAVKEYELSLSHRCPAKTEGTVAQSQEPYSDGDV